METWSGFYKRPLEERRRLVAEHAGLDEEEAGLLFAGSALPVGLAERFVENVVGVFPLPLGIALHFVVDGSPVLVPMAVEESSVVAAASHAAKWARATGGFRTEVMDPVTIGQVEVRDLADPRAAAEVVRREAAAWRVVLDASIPAMVERGGGVRDVVPRIVGDRLVVHLHLDTRDAMGANVTNRLCEALAPLVVGAVGGRPGLRILSNLATERLATARCTVPAEAVGGPRVVRAMVEANDLARIDPYRAATHNKGILNGVDPVVVATGNDWRAVAAGAHAYAALDGAYRGLTEYVATPEGDLEASVTLPLSLGTVGGVTSLHPVARVALKVLGDPDARRLAAVVASVGLAQNLAAVRALSGEGIQRGHMALHARNLALQAGLAGEAAEAAARRMVEEGRVNATRARELASD